MAKFEQIYVHIGETKAGSTSLQRFLRSASFDSLGLDLFYPGRAENHNGVADSIRHREGAASKVAGFRADMNDLQRRSRCIVSAENFSHLSPADLQQFIESVLRPFADTVHIVHYVRPHLTRMKSSYAEGVKIGGEARHFREFVTQSTRRGRFRRSPTINAYQELFRDAYVPRALIREHLIGGDIVTDFLTLVSGSSLSVPKLPAQNKSLDADGLAELQRLHNRIRDRSSNLRHAVGYEFDRLYRKLTAGQPAGPGLALSAKAAARFEGRYRRDAIEVDQALHLRRHGFVDSLARDMPAAVVGVASLQELVPSPAALAASKALRYWLALPLPDRALSGLIALNTRTRS